MGRPRAGGAKKRGPAPPNGGKKKIKITEATDEKATLKYDLKLLLTFECEESATVGGHLL